MLILIAGLVAIGSLVAICGSVDAHLTLIERGLFFLTSASAYFIGGYLVLTAL